MRVSCMQMGMEVVHGLLALIQDIVLVIVSGNRAV